MGDRQERAGFLTVAQTEARVFWEHEVVGSSPTGQTKGDEDERDNDRR